MDLHNVSLANRYDIKNISSGEECTNLLLKDVIDITKVSRGTVISRLNSKYKYGLPMKGWVLKHHNDNTYVIKDTVARYRYKLSKYGEKNIIIPSLRQLAKFLKIDRTLLTHQLKTSNMQRGYKITLLPS